VESRRKGGGGVEEEARQGETSHGSGGNRMYFGFFVLFLGFFNNKKNLALQTWLFTPIMKYHLTLPFFFF